MTVQLNCSLNCVTKLSRHFATKFITLIISTYCHSGSSTLGQILPVIRFALKTMAEMVENRDLGRGPPNITSFGSLEMVGLDTLI